MMRGTILRLLTMAYILRDKASDDAGGGGGPVERPDHIAEHEWEGLTEAERQGVIETDEGEGAHQIIGTGEEAEGNTTELSDEDLAAVLAGDETPPEKTAEELAAEAVANEGKTPEQIAAETAETQTVLEVTDEDLIAFRPQVSDTELFFAEEVPEEIQAKLDAADAKLDKADKWFEDGEDDDKNPFGRAEYNKLNREVSRERESINREIMQHQIAARDAQRDGVVWKKECNAFFAARKEYGESVEVDGKKVPTPKGKALYAALNTQIQLLNADPKNATKSGMQILVEADKAIWTMFNMPARGKAVAAAAKPGEKPAAVDRKALADLSKKTLSGVPVAQGENTDSVLTALTRLSGEAYERALERLTPEQRQALENQV